MRKAIDVSMKARKDWERRPQDERSEIFLKAADLMANKYRMDLMASTMMGQVDILFLISQEKKQMSTCSTRHVVTVSHSVID